MRRVVQNVLGRRIHLGLCGKSKFQVCLRLSSTSSPCLFRFTSQVYIVALLLGLVVIKIFNIPVYTAKDNLYGIIVLLSLFGIAAIQMVHLFEKLFNDASLANMYILCMNILIAMSTITSIILIDLLGNSDVSINTPICCNFIRTNQLLFCAFFIKWKQWSDQVRAVLNRVYLVLPQHAFADGLLELCKNYVVAEVFSRYYIDTYKSPLTTDLLLYHYVALIGAAIVFWIANFIVESGVWRSYLKSSKSKRPE